MAKKFVRGITDIKTINNQDLDTNNVNDLLSDGKHNYIHRKKEDGTEEYHNLTDNLKTLEAVENGLLTVTNYNNTTNSAELEVHHDQAKSQLLGSPDLTINVQNGENGSAELTTVDVNPAKVLQHENLLTGYGLAKTKDNTTLTLLLRPQRVENTFNIDSVFQGKIIGQNLDNSPSDGWFVYENDYMVVSGHEYIVQTATRFKLSGVANNEKYMRTLDNTRWSDWSKQLTDESVLSSKQDTITNNTSIGISGTGLQQLYTQSQTYTHANGILKTYVKSVANSTSVSTVEEEFNFLAKMNKSQTNAEFTLNEHDTAVFQYLVDTYGVDNKINVCGSLFTLNGSQLTFGSNGAQYNPHIINFCDIIPTSEINPTQ